MCCGERCAVRQVLVPDFAREIDGWDVSLYSSQFLTSTLHSRGINLRYLGLVRQHATCTPPPIAYTDRVVFTCTHHRTRYHDTRHAQRWPGVGI
jgi:hypothetical protein